jgi:prepilin-type N-terminal cleavage/methylation domain-containing protein
MIRTRRRPTGLTLIELLVVLAVLVILAGIVLPKLDGVLGKGHSAQGAAAIGDVARFMDTFRIVNGRYPDQYDSMLNAAGTAYAGLLPGARAKYIPTTLTQAEIDSLNLAGVTRVLRHDETAGVDVNDSAVLPAVALTTATPVMRMDVTNAEVQGVLLREFRQDIADVGTDNTDGARTYLVFGVGPQCTICNGKAGVMRDAPLHQDTDPGRFYTRFVVVFATSREAGEKAELIGVVGPDGDTMATHVREFLTSPE